MTPTRPSELGRVEVTTDRPVRDRSGDQREAAFLAIADLRFAAWFLWMTPLETALSSFLAASWPSLTALSLSPASAASRNLRTAVFRLVLTALLRSCRFSFCLLRLIWDLMFATCYAFVMGVDRSVRQGRDRRNAIRHATNKASSGARSRPNRAQDQPRRSASHCQHTSPCQRCASRMYGEVEGTGCAAETRKYAVTRASTMSTASAGTSRVTGDAASAASTSSPSPRG